MKRFILVLLALLVWKTSWGNDPTLEPLKIAFAPNHPPYSFLTLAQSPAGMWVDIWNLWAEKTGRTLQFEPLSSQESLEALQQGRVDILPAVFPEKNQAPWLGFSKPFYEMGTGLYYSREQKQPAKLDDFSDQAIGVVEGSLQEKYLQTQYPSLSMVAYAHEEALIEALLNEEIQAFLAEEAATAFSLQETGLFPEILHSGDTLFQNKVAAAVSKDQPALLEQVEQGLAQITPEEFKEIEARWIANPTLHYFPSPPAPAPDAMVAELQSLLPASTLSLGTILQQIALQSVAAVVAVALAVGLLYFLLQRYFAKTSAHSFLSNKTVGVGALLLGVFLAITLVIAQASLNQIEKQIKQYIASSLLTVAQTTDEVLTTWVDNQKAFVQQLTKERELAHLAKNFIRITRTEPNITDSLVLRTIRLFFQNKLRQIGENTFFIITPDFRNLVAAQNDSLGQINTIQKQRPHLLQKAFQGETVFIPPVLTEPAPEEGTAGTSKPMIFFASPLRDTWGEIIAVLAVGIDPAKHFHRLTQLGRIGQSGETYIFDQEGFLLSKSRFGQDLVQIGLLQTGEEEILRLRISDPGGNLVEGFQTKTHHPKPLTLMAASATEGNSGMNLEGYRDYRGVKVLGAWIWNENLGFGLATEIDETEALETFNSTRLIVIGILALVIFLSVAFTAFSLWSGLRTNRALRKAHEELEDKVQERTQEMASQRDLLRGIIANVNQGVATFDSAGKLEIWNEQYRQVVPLEELRVGMDLKKEILKAHAQKGDYGEGDWDTLIEQRWQTLHSGTPKHIVFKGRVYLSLPKSLPDGSLILSYTDITELEQAQKEAEEATALLKNIIANIPQGVVYLDNSYKVRIWNEGCLPIAPVEEIYEGMDFKQEILKVHAQKGAFGEGDLDALVEERFQILQHGQTLQTMFHGGMYLVHPKPLPAGGMVISYTDITEMEQAQKEAEQATKIALEQEYYLRITLDHMPSGIFLVDKNLKFQVSNANAFTFYDLPPDTLQKGMPFEKVLLTRAQRGEYGPGDPETLAKERLQAYQNLVQQGEEVFYEETTLSGRMVEVSRTPTNDGGVVMVVNDITKRKEAEKALEASLLKEKQAYEQLKTTKIELAETEVVAAMTNVFEKFVPRQFLNRIAAEGIHNIEVGKAQSTFITLLFADIRNFTNFSETISPQELLNFLNGYFERMSRPIADNRGFVDKFIGDAIMALFDRPGASNPQNAQSAIQAAIDMQVALTIYNGHRQKVDYSPINIGIGIHSGPIIFGTVGWEDRMDSTVLGDDVNLAARIERLTKLYQTPVLCSETTLRLLEDVEQFHHREIDWIRVRGKTEPVKIYEIFEADSPEIREKKTKTGSLIQQSLLHRQQQDWANASQLLEEALFIYPEDPVANLHKQRCVELQMRSLPADWDGIIDFNETASSFQFK